MLKEIVFFDEITLWWTKDEFNFATSYKFFLDDSYHGTTDKTHYSFLGLKANEQYHIRLEWCNEEHLIGKREFLLITKKEKKCIDITKVPYSACGDGKTLNTIKIQRALDECTENDFIYIPAGVYLTGALNVHSNTEIYLDKNAFLQGTANPTDYLPKIKSRFEGKEMECYRSLLNCGELNHESGYNCRNIIVRGAGTIFGGGRPLATNIIEVEQERLEKFMEQNTELVQSCETINTIPGRVRGRLINMSNCENVVLNGLTMGYGPSWNIHFIYSKDIVTYNCFIHSNILKDEQGNIIMDRVWNGDGWDPDSSENCVIFDTLFATGDDCIAIKSGKNPEGNLINRPTKNIYIFDCKTQSGHSVAIGSEMSGGVENVYIWDCDLKDCNMGVQIKATKERGGYVRNVYVRDSQMRTIYVRAKVPYNNDGEAARTLPVLENYSYENITLYGRMEYGRRDYIYLEGYEDVEHHLNNVFLKNIAFVGIEAEQGIYQNCVDNLKIEK